MDAIAGSGRNPLSKRHIQPEYGAGWRETGRPNLSRETKFSGANGDREFNTLILYGVNQMLNFVDSSSHASGLLRKLASCREPNSQNPYYQYEMRGPL